MNIEQGDALESLKWQIISEGAKRCKPYPKIRLFCLPDNLQGITGGHTTQPWVSFYRACLLQVQAILAKEWERKVARAVHGPKWLCMPLQAKRGLLVP